MGVAPEEAAEEEREGDGVKRWTTSDDCTRRTVTILTGYLKANLDRGDDNGNTT